MVHSETSCLRLIDPTPMPLFTPADLSHPLQRRGVAGAMIQDLAQEGSGTIVPDEAAGQRLDRFLMARLPDQSRSALQRLIDAGEARVNGAASKPGYHLRPGDEVTWRLPPPSLPTLEPEPIPLDVVFEDDDLLVINKAKGMVVHPAPGNWTGTLVNALLARSAESPAEAGIRVPSSEFRVSSARSGAHASDASGDDPTDSDISKTAVGDDASELGTRVPASASDSELGTRNPELFRPGIVHRLDRDTSGLLVVAKNELAYRSLQRQIQRRTAERRYLAVVRGNPKFERATVDAPLGRHPKDRKRMAVIPPGSGHPARDAMTELLVLESFPGFALLEAKLQTGRTHQIRVHCAYIGHPVVGDATYGPANPRDEQAPAPVRDAIAALEGQALHAHALAFRQPRTGEPMAFRAPPPADTERLIGALRDEG